MAPTTRARVTTMGRPSGTAEMSWAMAKKIMVFGSLPCIIPTKARRLRSTRSINIHLFPKTPKALVSGLSGEPS